jgi:hypothetical protein
MAERRREETGNGNAKKRIEQKRQGEEGKGPDMTWHG